MVYRHIQVVVIHFVSLANELFVGANRAEKDTFTFKCFVVDYETLQCVPDCFRDSETQLGTLDW